jgi:hypothetical protein
VRSANTTVSSTIDKNHVQLTLPMGELNGFAQNLKVKCSSWYLFDIERHDLATTNEENIDEPTHLHADMY